MLARYIIVDEVQKKERKKAEELTEALKRSQIS
jgi:hypothetical protein